ncbi:hypothetical protein WOLCODRAFT_155599 [Wolfiporia cocos MD-104 SS10]|uniref:Uncharacterized protein n=1 Tax=Wolfiporia cocos (strain MD-104) TaxID=742152 RepID=A0A2H3J593_WOLCO|nr:hypothetical protein WOLCODRAFT_155599 [Wolfiporia cocos MD-104 SS10]
MHVRARTHAAVRNSPAPLPTRILHCARRWPGAFERQAPIIGHRTAPAAASAAHPSRIAAAQFILRTGSSNPVISVSRARPVAPIARPFRPDGQAPASPSSVSSPSQAEDAASAAAAHGACLSQREGHGPRPRSRVTARGSLLAPPFRSDQPSARASPLIHACRHFISPPFSRPSRAAAPAPGPADHDERLLRLTTLARPFSSYLVLVQLLFQATLFHRRLIHLANTNPPRQSEMGASASAFHEAVARSQPATALIPPFLPTHVTSPASRSANTSIAFAPL